MGILFWYHIVFLLQPLYFIFFILFAIYYFHYHAMPTLFSGFDYFGYYYITLSLSLLPMPFSLIYIIIEDDIIVYFLSIFLHYIRFFFIILFFINITVSHWYYFHITHINSYTLASYLFSLFNISLLGYLNIISSSYFIISHYYTTADYTYIRFQ